MANKLRFINGMVDLRGVRPDPEYKIEAGDLCILTRERLCRPANAITLADCRDPQEVFAACFLGVAQQSHARGSKALLVVDLSPLSIYEFDVVPDTIHLGDQLMAVLQGDPKSTLVETALMSQKLIKCQRSYGIATAVESVKQNDTVVRVQFASAFHPASANVHAQMGGRPRF